MLLGHAGKDGGHGHAHGKQHKSPEAGHDHGHAHGALKKRSPTKGYGSVAEEEAVHSAEVWIFFPFCSFGCIEFTLPTCFSSHMQDHQIAMEELENINVRAAYIHALGDLVQSVGVAIAGLIIWLKPEWQLADPLATFLFSILVLATTVGIVKSSIRVLMEGTPEVSKAGEE